MKILLLNPPYFEATYQNSKHKIAVIQYPPLNLALLAAMLRDAGHTVKIADLNIQNPYSPHVVIELIQEYQPHLVGMTMTSAQYDDARDLNIAIKTKFPQILSVVGGPHATALPRETLEDCHFDVAVIGEGEATLCQIAGEDDLAKIPNIWYRSVDGIKSTARDLTPLDMNALPAPAWDLLDLNQYHATQIMSRRERVGPLETSRGCPYGCLYCNKNIFGKKFRYKSPGRVVDEIEQMLELGLEEIHIVDDNFSTNIERAKDICREIIARGLKFPWSPWNGLRVDRVDAELMRLMKQAGCYRIHIGIESGNQHLLDRMQKGTRLEQIRQAVQWIKAAKMEVFGCFMLGLLDETEATMQQTIAFAKELKLDYAKFTIMTPMPGTELFDYLDQRGLIKHKQWSKYNFSSTAEEMYQHPSLSWEVITKTYNQAYREFYLSPGFILRRIFVNFSLRRLGSDFVNFLKIKW